MQQVHQPKQWAWQGGGAVEEEEQQQEEPWYRGRWVKQQAVTVALMPKSKRGQLHFA